MQWTSYVHMEGTRKEQVDMSDEVKWDWEIFANQMKLLRGWTPAQAMAEWERLLNDPCVQRDNCGPAHSQLRLHIPAALTGQSCQRVSAIKFEEKRLEYSNKKASSVSAEDLTKMRAELHRGFSRIDLAPLLQESHLPLQMGALTAEGSSAGAAQTVGNMLTSALDQPCGVLMNDDTASEKPSVEEGQKKQKVEIVIDIKSARNVAQKMLKKESDDIRSKIEKDVTGGQNLAKPQDSYHSTILNMFYLIVSLDSSICFHFKCHKFVFDFRFVNKPTSNTCRIQLSNDSLNCFC